MSNEASHPESGQPESGQPESGQPEAGQPEAGHPKARARRVADDYAGGAERPLGAYAVLLGTYLTLVSALVGLARRRRVRLPERLSAADLALMTVAVYRASRLVSKDSVTAVARAPFTRFEGAAGEGEVNEAVPGGGLRHAIGELVSCPFCVSVWIATALAFGLTAAPRATRLVCSTLAAVTGADFLQLAFAAARSQG